VPQLIAVTYPDLFKAEEVRLKLWKLQQEYLLELDDAVVITKDANGKIKLHQAINLTAISAVSGGFWGTLIGMIFLNPIFGAAMGVTWGAISGALTDIGINDQFMKDLSAKLPVNTSALFVLVRNATPDKVVAGIASYGGTVLQSSLTHEDEAKLQAALNRCTYAPPKAMTESSTTPTHRSRFPPSNRNGNCAPLQSLASTRAAMRARVSAGCSSITASTVPSARRVA
jgi:uncharacterized membrane protein